MYDKLSELQAEVTKTASFNGAAFDLGAGGYPNERLMARVLYSAAKQASGSGTIAFSIEHSDASSSGFTLLSSGAADTITLTTSDQDGEIFIPITTPKRYVRLVCTITGGSTPTITYSGEIGTAAP